MLYMVVERFRDDDPTPVYRRLREEGRMLPEGVEYVDSWVSEDLTRCYQLMRAEEAAPVHAWCETWSDLVEFEVVPVLSSGEASQAVEEDLRG